jgi:hypothetical protein
MNNIKENMNQEPMEQSAPTITQLQLLLKYSFRTYLIKI